MRCIKSITVWVALVLLITGCKVTEGNESIDLRELTIAQIHKAYVSGTSNSQQLISDFLKQIEANDGKINALTCINPDALSLAEQLDKEYHRTRVLRPLHRIPVIVKDNINAKGLPTTAGSLALQHYIPDENAFHCALVGFRTTLGLISRSAIVPLFLRNDVVGPMCRTVEDATKVLEIVAGYDPADPRTKYSEGKIPANYTRFLAENGLQGSSIGVLRELSDNDPDPEIKSLFEIAILDLDSLGAQITDPAIIPGFSSLKQNRWCSAFRKDLETYLAQYVKSDSMKTLEDIIRIGSRSEFAEERLKFYAQSSGRYDVPDNECLDVYHDPRCIAFREAIEKVMDSLELDAMIYPSWNNKAAGIDAFAAEYKGDNNQVIAPHTGQPALAVPMGFCKGNLPAGLQFLGRMYDEPTLIRMAYSYEQGTKHRKPPWK